MNNSFSDKIADRTRWGYLGAFILLLISYIVSFITAQNLARQSAWVSHSNEVIHSLDNLLRYVTESESAARGYIITQNKTLLNNFKRSTQNADSVWQDLKNFTGDNPAQQTNLDSLKKLVNRKLNFVQSSLLIFDKNHSIDTLLKKQGEGIQRMADVEKYTKYIKDTEMNLLRKRTSQAFRYSDIIKLFTIVSLILAVLLTLYSVITFNKENKAKREASEKANSYRAELEKRVDELGSLNLELIELRNIEKFAATGRIARTIAHEVRNPLTNISLATEQIKNEIKPDEDISVMFEMISRNLNRINQLTNDLLNATRVSELNFSKLSINKVIDESLEFARDRIELKKINVIKNYDNRICHTVIDKEKVIIAFLNIIVNAIEAMPENGTLRISTEAKNNRCVVRVSDNGKGMPKDVINNLFEPFFTTKPNGTGLGLTNTQNIIIAHNGTINVESEVKKGTTFIMTFALAES